MYTGAWKGMKEVYSSIFENEMKAVCSLLRMNGVKYRSREYGPWFRVYVMPQSVNKAKKLIQAARREADRRK